MVDYLKKFIDGETIQANDTNDNNDYILDKITDTASTLNTRINTINSNVSSQIDTLMKTLFPIGAIYLSITENCPLEGFIGHWEKVSSGRVLQGADDTHAVDTTISAGLPNITGWLGFYSGLNPWQQSGALSSNGHGGNAGSGAPQTGDMTFNASASNSIYRDDVDTVQPPAYVVNVWKRVS